MPDLTWRHVLLIFLLSFAFGFGQGVGSWICSLLGVQLYRKRVR